MIFMEKQKNIKGFTLAETMVAVAIFALLELGVTAVISAMYQNYNQQSVSLNNVDMARKITFNFAGEIRNAAYGNDGSYSLNQAGDSQIIFYSNADLTSGVVNRIRYYLSNGTLYKGVIRPSGSPLTYNPADEAVKVVETNLANNGTPVFYYYDGDYSGNQNPLSQPVNVTQVKFVKINLMISDQIGKVATTSVISAGAAIRNLKTNLGN